MFDPALKTITMSTSMLPSLLSDYKMIEHSLVSDNKNTSPTFCLTCEHTVQYIKHELFAPTP